jgi:hypothetical protein
MIARSLTQTKALLEFKCTKTDEPRVTKIPEETEPKLEAHRKGQDEFRLQSGPDYRADLDLIFANPGSPLKPDSFGERIRPVQAPEDPEAEGRISPPPPAHDGVPDAGRRCTAAGGFAAARALLRKGDRLRLLACGPWPG